MAKITYKILSIEKGRFNSPHGIYLKVEKTIKKWFKDQVVETHTVFGEGVVGKSYYNWYYTSSGKHLQRSYYDALISCVYKFSKDTEIRGRQLLFKNEGF